MQNSLEYVNALRLSWLVPGIAKLGQRAADRLRRANNAVGVERLWPEGQPFAMQQQVYSQTWSGLGHNRDGQ
jgi:hypothetical protein